MFESLLDSKLKKRILAIFFAFPERSFYINEIREMIGAGSSKAPSVLRDLEKARVVKSTTRKRKKYYQIDSRISWYEELATMVSDSKIPKTDLVSRRLKKLKTVQEVIITGIFCAEPNLEIDLLIVGKRPTAKTLDKILTDLENWAGQDISYAILEPEDFQHRVLMNDRFVRDILDNKHIKVVNKTNKNKKRKKK